MLRFVEKKLNEKEMESFPTDLTSDDVKDLATGTYTWMKGRWSVSSDKRAFTLFEGNPEGYAEVRFNIRKTYKVSNRLRDPNSTVTSAFIEIGYKLPGNSKFYRVGDINFKSIRGENPDNDKALEGKLINWANKVLGIKLSTSNINYS